MNEILGLRMVSVHNSHMFLKVMADVRAHLAAETFGEFRREFVANYRPTEKILLARQMHAAAAQERYENSLRGFASPWHAQQNRIDDARRSRIREGFRREMNSELSRC